ncbi:MAG: class I SAM-dependent methyltransferase [Bacillota bacterium]|nr:class I SAM-dependent methyltransferase [Bacillota bacterium]
MAEEKNVYLYKNPNDYNVLVKKTIPHYEIMLNMIVDGIPLAKDESMLGLDIGCGTGNVSRMLLQSFPHLRMDCIDFSPEMLQVLSKNLSEFDGRYSVSVRDIRKFRITQSYDLVVSNLSIHHIENLNNKRQFFAQVFGSLPSGGIFVFGDLFCGSSPYIQQLYVDNWKAFQVSQGREQSEVDRHFERMKDVDFPSPLYPQLKILQEIGFLDIDCLFKWYGFGVVACRK